MRQHLSGGVAAFFVPAKYFMQTACVYEIPVVYIR